MKWLETKLDEWNSLKTPSKVIICGVVSVLVLTAQIAFRTPVLIPLTIGTGIATFCYLISSIVDD
jgi:hypothetical protein